MEPTPQAPLPHSSEPALANNTPGDLVRASRVMPLMVALSLAAYPLGYFVASSAERTLEEPLAILIFAAPIILVAARFYVSFFGGNESSPSLPLPCDQAIRLSLFAMLLSGAQLLGWALLGMMPMGLLTSAGYLASVGFTYLVTFAYPTQLLTGANASRPYYTTGYPPLRCEALFVALCLAAFLGGIVYPIASLGWHPNLATPLAMARLFAPFVSILIVLFTVSAKLFDARRGWQRGIVFAAIGTVATLLIAHTIYGSGAMSNRDAIEDIAVTTLTVVLFAGGCGLFGIEAGGFRTGFTGDHRPQPTTSSDDDLSDSSPNEVTS